jgi:uncharacterized membrane protein YccC
MNSNGSVPARIQHWWAALTVAGREVAREEFPLWIQALRTTTAMLVALVIAFRLDLSSPSSAAVTVAVISLPQSGMVLEKSFYRLLATLAGGLVTLLLIAVFAQQRDLFIVVVALWVGICAAMSFWHRNFQSYGWALAGYTACLIGFPAYDHAEHAFDIVVDRVSIVALGIICGGIINATVFPRSSVDSLIQTVRRCFRDFTHFAHSTLYGYRSRDELQATQRQFLNDIAALESARASSFFEDSQSRIRTPRLRRFINQFMVASTTAHAINRLRNDLLARGLQPVVAALEPLCEIFLRALHAGGREPPAAAAEAVAVVGQLGDLLKDWDRHAQFARTLLGENAATELRVELESSLAMLREFIEAARDFAETYAELRAPRSALDRAGSGAAVVRADPVAAIIAGLRAGLTVIVICVFWIVSGWADGYAAALLGAVACTLFVNAPAPSQSVWQMVRGFTLGFVAGVICFTFILPALDGWLLLAAGLTPFLLVGTYLMARPQTAGLGSGYCMMFLVSLSITATMQYDVVALLNGGLAQIIGVIAAAIAFTIIFPINTDWHTRRVEKTLWRELLIARHESLTVARHRFESGARDISLQFINLATSDTKRRHRLIDSMTLLEAGHAIIAVRTAIEQPVPKIIPRAIDEVLDAAVTAFNTAPGVNACAVLAAAERDTQFLQADVDARLTSSESLPAAGLRAALLLLRLALAERRTQLTEYFAAAQTEEIDNATRA